MSERNGNAPDIMPIGLVVCCTCSDGKMRAVIFAGKQAKQVYGYLKHIQGGTLKCHAQPVLLVEDLPQICAAIDTAMKPPAAKAGLIERYLARCRELMTRHSPARRGGSLVTRH